MGELFKQMREQLRYIVTGASTGKKISFLMLFILITAAFLALFLWSRRPDFQPLYSNLSPEDSGSIVSYLKGRKVPYRLVGSGEGILVPSADVYELRLEIAGKGLPRGSGVGFEIFDKRNFGMTEFMERLNFQRALQGELARTINQFDEVETSRVHIVMPERSLFIEDQKKASASVVLKLQPGKMLNKSQVQSIVHLVASSVEGLDPSQVTVVDVGGKLLAGGGDEDEMSLLSSTQLEYKRNLEKSLEGRVESMLEKVAGRGKAIARVSASLDLTMIERTEETYDPDSAVVRSEQRLDERSSGEGGTPMGVPGVASNEPGAATSQEVSNKSSYRKQNETINYEISKSVRKVVEPAGEIKKLSVAVMVDGSYKTEGGEKGEGGSKVYVPRTEEEMAKFDAIIKNAVGFDGNRGDKVEVVNIPFEDGETAFADLGGGGMANKELLLMMVRYGIIAAFLVAIFLFILRPLLRWLTVPPVPIRIAGELPRSVSEIEDELAQGGGVLAAADRARALEGGSVMPNRAVEIARRNPERAAQVLKGWLGER